MKERRAVSPATGAAARPEVSADGFDAGSRWFLGVVLVALALTVAHAAYRETLPSDGWYVAGNIQGNFFTRNLSGLPSPLQSGDALVAIDGRSVQSIADDWAEGPQVRPTLWLDGSRVLYTVRRDGQLPTIPVPLRSQSPLALIGSFVTEGIDGPLLILIEILLIAVFCHRPRNPATRVVLVLITGALIARIVHTPSGTIPREILFDPLALYPTRIMETANPLIVLPSLIYLFLVFPVLKEPVRRHPRLTLLAVYAPMPLLYLATWLHPTTARWTYAIVAG